MKKLELLAPAKNKEIAMAAITHGADAVYIGADSFGARKNASNTLDDIKSVVEFAHQFDARVYVTLNTIVFDDELSRIERLIKNLYLIETDALIIQDLGILRLDIPPIALHASTQCDIRTVEKAKFLKSLGFTRLILPREFTFEEIADFHRNLPDIELEAFVHGALCVSYSGDCRASFRTTGRSANRGECAQLCRLPYNLTEVKGKILVENSHLLSLKDLSRIEELENLINSGITTFKIEGRLKDMAYVKNIVAAYRNRIDSIIASEPNKYQRSSSGTTEVNFIPDITKSFNRGFTSYFGTPLGTSQKIASSGTPKWVGVPVGNVERILSPRKIKIVAREELSNGDGLSYFDEKGKFHGFRVNKIEDNVITLNETLESMPVVSTTLFRNHDIKREAMLASETAKRTIGVTLQLRPIKWGVSLRVVDENGNMAELTMDNPNEIANTDQKERHRTILQKSGNTIFKVNEIENSAGEIFIPASLLTDLRRRTLDKLLKVRLQNHRPEPCGKVDQEALSSSLHLSHITASENVTNHLSRNLYVEAGAKRVDWSIEKLKREGEKSDDDLPLMTCRYCIRREFGKCLKTKSGSEWPEKIFLKPISLSQELNSTRFRLDFDCKNCRMRVFKD